MMSRRMSVTAHAAQLSLLGKLDDADAIVFAEREEEATVLVGNNRLLLHLRPISAKRA